jgi:site-specific recombinase XerD
MTMAERRLAKATPPGSRGPAMELRREAPEDLRWEAAIRTFVEGWAADHPGIRQTTLEHYHEQLANRIAAFATERGIASVQDLTRQDLRAFVVWLDGLVTANGKPLTPRGKDMALATAKRFLGWLYQEQLLPQDIAAHVGTYRLDMDPEPKATPAADLEEVLSSLDLSRPTGVRNMAMIHLMAFCGLRVAELVGLNATDLDLEEGRVRVRAETSKVRRTRFVDLPLTLSDGREVVKPEVAELMASWLRLRSRACPHLDEKDALFVTLGPNQFAFGTNAPGPDARPPGERLTTDAVRTVLKRLASKAGVDPHLVTPHRLRHYFGLSSAMAGVPTTALMRALGHRTPLMTARYSEFADAERRWAFARADITNGIRLGGTCQSAGVRKV